MINYSVVIAYLVLMFCLGAFLGMLNVICKNLSIIAVALRSLDSKVTWATIREDYKTDETPTR